MALLALLVLLSGCSGITPSNPDTNNSNCNIDSLAFWSAHENQGWASDELRVGYELSGSADILLVAYENDSVLGVKHVTSGQAVASDGEFLQLDRPLVGNHTVRVLAYGDTNGNGQFDPQTDTRCSVETDSLTLNFSALNKTTTST